ncbi:MAG: hypothetical protein R3336_05890 [Phycisphaeraceae bacterium]|nr:hypothetical protein [Phycisphaeraceae bacterium]
MSPSLTSERIVAHASDLDEGFVRRQLAGLDPDYGQRFGPEEAADHMAALAGLGDEHPVQVEVELRDASAGEAVITIFAFDHAFEFSLITGVLAGAGFRIEAGDVFTVRAESGENERARIIDRFEGRLEVGREAKTADDAAEALGEQLREVLTLLHAGDEASVERAKHLVNERVTHRLAGTSSDATGVLYPVSLDLEQTPEATRLRIVSQDTPAFLYSLSTALSLNELSIERVRIGGEAGRVEDEIDFTNRAGEPVTDPDLLDRIRFSVLMTKQFTYFLDRSPDPYTALQRFAELVEKARQSSGIESLADPRAMQDLAKLLGASDFLWEDFIRLQYEQLGPIFKPHLEAGEQFCEPIETLPMRMDAALAGAVGLAEQRDRLNAFKDREIFRIDLDQILTPGSDFAEMSHRLTALAEALVGRAAKLVYDDLVKSYGHPLTVKGERCPYAVFGLGKLGGVALGYASDIELLFVYESNGKTTGGKRKTLPTNEFFNQLVRDVTRFIKTKREAIFQVDLRLRPYGDAGPLAVSRSLFERYYRPKGKAHAFERLALVRMRAIAGDLRLGEVIEELRDRFVYENPSFDLEALWELWEKQHQQKVPEGERNAKYSPGALVDLETTVQLLQIRHGDEEPSLRTPQIREALDALRQAGALKLDECDELIATYRFLRRLINGLRMLRGSAEDLALPAPDSEELLHLARRLGYEDRDGLADPGGRLLADFESHAAGVQAFVSRHFGRPCPGTGGDDGGEGA